MITTENSKTIQSDAIANSYGRPALKFTSAHGIRLTDSNGRQWFDALSGIGVANLGHCNSRINEALTKQMQTLDHISNLYASEPQNRAAEALCRAANMEEVFFCNSGTEANEAAIKLARLHGMKKRGAAGRIICFTGAFHGRSLGALSATAKEAIRAPFYPLLDTIEHVPFGAIEAVREALASHHDYDAILLEPIQGEAGVICPPSSFIPELEKLCEEHELLLMIDEVQSGNGRTGKYFAFQHSAIQPDVVTTAKGLANGFPAGATLLAGRATGLFTPGTHGSTYGGNPMACAAIEAVYATLSEPGFLQNVTRVADAHRHELARLLGTKLHGFEGMGLMLGLQLVEPKEDLSQRLFDQGILVNVINNSRIRLLPPLIMSVDEAKELAAAIAQAID